MELRALLRREVSFFKSVVAFCHFICNLWSIKKEKKKKKGNENVSSSSLGRGNPLQAAEERWHLGWAGAGHTP